MKKNKKIFESRFTIAVTNIKLVVGCFIGICYAIIFYCFLHLFRKSIIIFSSTQNDYELFILSPSKVNFYNFLFAFIAVFYAFSIVINGFLDRPKKFLSKYNYLRNSILNQQRLMNWFFLNWFARIGFFIGLLALDYDSVDIYSEHKQILIIFVLAFLGQIWMSIRWFFKKNKLFWFFMIFLTTVSFSFGLSQINILNDELIDKSILRKNTLYRHDIHVSVSEVSTKIRHKYLTLDILVPKQVHEQLLIVDGKKIGLEDFEKSIFKFRDKLSESLKPFITYTLFVDRNVEMKFVRELKQRLIKIDARRIYYATRKVRSEKPFYYKSNKGLGFYLQEYIPYEEINNSKGIDINILSNDFYFFNGKAIKKDDLTKELKKYFQDRETQSFRIHMNERTKFYEYFQVLESSKKTINDLRDYNCKKSYGINYVDLDRKHKGKKYLREKYPWQVIDEFK